MNTYISELNTRVNGFSVTEHDDTNCETFRVYLSVRPRVRLSTHPRVYVFSIAFNAI